MFRLGLKKAGNENDNVMRSRAVDTNPYTGQDISFSEFIKFVIASEMGDIEPDAHIESVKNHCKHCVAQYNYVGRMECFSNDALFLVEKLGMNKSVDHLKTAMRTLATDDAITDSIRSPFQWKNAIRRYIPWHKALSSSFKCIEL